MIGTHGSLLTCNLPEELPSEYSITRLTGDASSRSYFRITLPDRTSVILMTMPDPFDPENFPYLENYHLLRSVDIPVAEIYAMEPSRGFVLLQDLGDFTAYELYNSWNQQQRLLYFLRSLDYLHRIEQLAPVGGVSFTPEKFLWELDYFKKHFLCGIRNCVLSDQELSELAEHFQRLAGELSSRVYSHRDYHSRNLMVQNETLYVIDFQDARLGPVTYDLASLCYDSYIQHSPEFIMHLERMFFVYHPDAEIQRYEYPRMCLQRNLKALGTFGYQAMRLGRPFYIQFIEPTLGYIQHHFDALPEYAEFRKLLARHITELGE